ncbi:aromatic ring-hydroxylating oxygenase subunit alpha [Candidatus Poriferisodalis sp.]|uniref:aromatic ring-hydroxylating oxygenase subunit alpha n=1 Tax=Candidatus Poriferisodalis sp. TaxID=3101277 RepID=UPI003B51F594
MTIVRGEARSTGPSYQSILLADATPPPAPLLEEAYSWEDTDQVDIDRYVSREFHQLEAQRLWPSTWQMACRLEHIPEVGDYIVYEICNISLVVVRTETDQVRAFHNSCLHRGTTLVEGDGNAAFFKCPFHGFAWNLDGSFRGMPASWDFPHVDGPDFCLPEAAVALWGGFVMVNPDGTAEPFERYAAPLTEHFEPYRLDDRYVAHHAVQVVEANWKATQEAFLEGYHVATTHPQAKRISNDFACAYDVFGPNLSRIVQAQAVPANDLVGQIGQAEIARSMQRLLPAQDRQEVPDDVDARSWLAERFRESLGRRWRHDLAGASEAAMLDSIQYFVFPNFCPWAGYQLPIAYRFRPWDDDPNLSLMEMMLLHPMPDDGEWESAAPHWLDVRESWAHAPGFESLGAVIDQDIANLHRVQRGMRAAQHRYHTFSDYQEIRIRHFHRRLDDVIGRRS